MDDIKKKYSAFAKHVWPAPSPIPEIPQKGHTHKLAFAAGAVVMLAAFALRETGKYNDKISSEKKGDGAER